MKNKILGISILISILFAILCVNLISAAEGDWISNFSVAGEVGNDEHGVTTNGTDYWVVDYDTDKVYHYNITGDYLDEFSLNAGNTAGSGITTNGTDHFVVDANQQKIFEYRLSGTYVGSIDISSSSQAGGPNGIANNGTNLLTVDRHLDIVVRYDMEGNYLSNFSIVDHCDNGFGITMNGTNIWVSNFNQTICKYNHVSETFLSSWTTTSKGGNIGITNNRTDIWVLENSNEMVYHYEGLPFAIPGEVQINLISPANNVVLSVTETNFTVNYAATNFNFTNTTYYIWNSTGVFNNSVFVDITGVSNSTTELIAGFILGNYEWNVFACYENSTFSNCSFADTNYSFSVGALIHNINYSTEVYETSSQTFTANITLLSGSGISLAQLIYNGTHYDVSDITISGDNIILNKTIDIPKNPDPFQNTTNDFLFSFTYTDVTSTNQNTTLSNQNVSFINLQLCSSTYVTQSINLSLRYEINKSLINSASNNTNAQATFWYWLGNGVEIKNYSFERLSSSTNNSYEICIFPNRTFKVDMDMVYSAQDYDERTYILRNASITNITSVLDLFLLYENLATKFTIEVRQGVSILKSAVVTVARFFVGEGSYRTISIRETDEAGEFVEYLDLDNDYRYSIVKDGVLLGVIDKKSTCTEAPCEFTLQIAEDIGNIFGGYEDNYAINVFTNLSFDIDTKIFTYDFIDITGLAQYFRLRVTRGAYNGTGVEICNQQIFSSSGSMTCNVTGYEGNFVAVGTVSRSPELITDILETALDLLRDSLGLMAIFISFAIILTITLAGAVLSGGNPSMVLGGFGLGILATKLMTLLPFSWGLVALFELVILIIMGWLKT